MEHTLGAKVKIYFKKNLKKGIAGTIPVKSRQAFPFYSEVARVLKLNFNCFFSQKQGKLLWW